MKKFKERYFYFITVGFWASVSSTIMCITKGYSIEQYEKQVRSAIFLIFHVLGLSITFIIFSCFIGFITMFYLDLWRK